MAKKRRGWFGDSKRHSEAAKKGALKKATKRSQTLKQSKKITIDSPESLGSIAKLQDENLKVQHVIIKLRPNGTNKK